MFPRLTGLWRNPDFMKLWVGQTISEFGSHITRDGLGLVAVMVLHATPEDMGLLSALSMLPVLLFGIFAGVPVDRFRRRPIMLLVDTTRLLLLLSIPFAYLTGRLSMALVIGVAAAMSILGVVFDAAYRAILPSLVTQAELLEGNTKLATTEALSEIGGSAIAGLLIQWIGAPLAIFFDSMSYIFSLVSFGLIRTEENPPKRDEHESANLRREIVEGLRTIAHDPLLRILAIGTSLRSFFGMFFGTLYGLYALRDLQLDAASLGFLIACGGIGALAGAFVAQRLVTRFGMGRALFGVLLVGAASNYLIPFAGGSYLTIMVMMIAGQIIGDGAMSIYMIHAMTLRQTRTPEHLLGRVNASMAFLGEAAAPLGALISGALAGMIGTRTALLIAVTGIALIAIITGRALRQALK
jgi:Na+/melibiose symporter-like transporter